MANNIENNIITRAVYLPAIRQDITKSQQVSEIPVRAPEEIFKFKGQDSRSDKSQEEKVFEEIEKNTLIFKNSSGKRKYLIDKITSLIKDHQQNKDNIGADNEPHIQKQSVNSEEKDSSKDNEKNNNVQNKDILSFDEIKEDINNNINKGFLKNIIDKHQDIIVSVTKASQEVVNFFQKVALHLTSIPSEQKVKNITSLKGILFDMLI
jgi:hypothetical protein